MFETNKLRGRIIEKFGSQTAFCSAVGNCTSHVSSYLKGKTTLSQNTIAKWAAALDILESAYITKHTVTGVLPHRAGVEQDKVRL